MRTQAWGWAPFKGFWKYLIGWRCLVDGGVRVSYVIGCLSGSAAYLKAALSISLILVPNSVSELSEAIRTCCLLKAALSISEVLLPIKSCLVHISDTDAHVSQAVRNCCLFKAALSMSQILVPVPVPELLQAVRNCCLLKLPCSYGAYVSQAVRNCCLFKAALSMSRILVPVSVSNCFGVRENVY